MAPGRYRVQFRDGSSPPQWASVYWQQQPTWSAATLLELTTADQPRRDGIDAVLSAGASVRGTARDQDDDVLGGVCVIAVTDTPNGPDSPGQATTQPDGTYELTGLPPGDVRVLAQDCHGTGPFLSQWWSGAGSYADADLITLAAGESRADVDFVLDRAATITGTVRNGDGQPLAGICVQATTAAAFGGLTQTSSDGTCVLGRPAGGPHHPVRRLHAGSPLRRRRPTVVDVAPGESARDVDAVLALGATATITGSVRNADGVAVTDARVVVYMPNQYALFGAVEDDGTFAVTGIPSGTYAIGFVGCGDVAGQPTVDPVDPVDPTREYTAQWWEGVDLSLVVSPDPIAQGATMVAIPPGATLDGFVQCFGCTPTPPTTTTTTAPAIAGLRSPQRLAASTPAIAVPRSPGQAAAVTFTATCTEVGRTTVLRATGSGSPLSLTGAIDTASYTCVVAAYDGDVLLALSAAVVVGPLTAGGLPATGSDATTAPFIALGLVTAGAVLVITGRRRRRQPAGAPPTS